MIIEWVSLGDQFFSSSFNQRLRPRLTLKKSSSSTASEQKKIGFAMAAWLN